MGNAGIIITAVHWWHRLRDPAPGSIAALLVALLAAARSGEAVTLNPGDILVNGFVQVIGSEQAAIIRLNPIDGKSTVVAQGDKLVFPSGIAIALDGDLLVADGQGGRSSSGGRVIRVNPADPNLATNQTVVSPPPGGNSPNLFGTPSGIAIAANGDLFVVDSSCCGGDGGVIRVNPATGHQTVVSPPPGGNSPNHFREPNGIAIAANGDLFVSDLSCCGGQGGVIRVNPVDGNQTVVASLNIPSGIAIAENGDLLVADFLCCTNFNGGVIRVNPVDGSVTPVAQGGHFNGPTGIAIASNGDLIVVDPGDVIRVNPAGGGQTVVASAGTIFSGPLTAVAIVPVPKNPILIVTSFVDSSIVAVNPVDGSQRVVAAGVPLVNPSGIAIARSGALFVADPGCCEGGRGGVVRVDPADGSQVVAAQGVNFSGTSDFPFGIAIAPMGDLFVTDSNCCGAQGEIGVIRVNPADPNLATNQTVVAKGDKLGVPIGIAVAGNGDLLVADVEGVIRVNPADPNLATNQTVVSTGQHFSTPSGIAIAANGDLFVVDSSCCGGDGGVIRVNPATGHQTVVSPPPGSNSPNHFHEPSGIAIAANGDLFVADFNCCGGQGGVIRVNPVDGTQTVVVRDDKVAGAFGIAFTRLLRLDLPTACGGSVPCACGDRVVRDRTLRGSDPVTRTACPADGLIVADGVTLDLGGATLRGQGAGVGVRIEAGASDVTVRRGAISGFATGVHGEGTTAVSLASVQVRDSSQDGVILTGDGHTVEKSVIEGSGGLGVAVVGHAARLSRLQVRGSRGAGVRLLGDGHVLEKSEMAGNAGRGAEVSGDRNQVVRLEVEGNGDDGVLVIGTGNQVAKNAATRNRGNGLEIEGELAVVERNEATSNGGAGLEIHGTGHRVSSNVAEKNTGTGLHVVGTAGSQFDRNQSENNHGFGIADDSTGMGTSGTANSYTKNVCGTRNARGASSPAGLCR